VASAEVRLSYRLHDKKHDAVDERLQSHCTAVAPFDTGNLRYNAIRAYRTPTGFRVVMLYTAAFYGAILDQPPKEGTRQHTGWWSTKCTLHVQYIDSVLNNKQSNFQVDHAGVAKFAPDNPERQARFYNSMVADEGREKFLAGK
jgi:hypothetical protein